MHLKISNYQCHKILVGSESSQTTCNSLPPYWQTRTCSQAQPNNLSLHLPEMNFAFSNWWEKHQIKYNMMHENYMSLNFTVSQESVTLNNATLIHLHILQQNSCNRHHMAHGLKYLPHGPLQIVCQSLAYDSNIVTTYHEQVNITKMSIQSIF